MPDEIEALWKEIRSLRARIAHLETVGGYGGPVGDADTVDGLHAAEIPFYNAYVCVRDKKAQNTHGGTFTQDAWQTRDINDEQADTAGICSIAANRVTLAAGTYRCVISAPAFRIGRHQLRLYNFTDSAVLLVGTSQDADVGGETMNRSFIVGRFTLAAAKTLEIQHRCATTLADWGLGVACNWTDEIYVVAEFWRET